MAARVVDFPEPVGGHDDEPHGQLDQGFDGRREPELCETGDLEGDDPQGQRARITLVEGVAAEAGPLIPAEGEVNLSLGLVARHQIRTDDLFDRTRSTDMGLNISPPVTGRISPSTRISGGAPEVSRRSVPRRSHSSSSQMSMSAVLRLTGMG